MTKLAYVGVDQDGGLLSCAALVDGVWQESFATHAAIEVSGGVPANTIVFETDQRRFRIREEDVLPSFSSMVVDDPAVHRVRVLQALLDSPLLAEGRPLKVALGIPAQRFFQDLGAGLPDAQFQEEWLLAQEVAVMREPAPSAVNVVSRTVASRGIAAYFDWTRDDVGQVREERQHAVTTVLDVGARDTAVLTFEGDTIRTDQSGFIPLGYLSVLAYAEVVFQHQYAVPYVRTRALFSILFQGQYRHRGETLDAIPMLVEGAEDLVVQLLAALQRFGVEEDALVVVGPAADVVVAGLHNHGRAARRPDSPAFANARGMAKFLRGGGA